MTLAVLIESLRAANHHIHASLERWQASRLTATATRAQDLFALRQEIVRTANYLCNIPREWAQDNEVEQEISQYRANLEQLVRVLPAVQLRLQAHKGRLEAALHHLNAVNAWADASRKSL
jgi:hypothetical protein